MAETLRYVVGVIESLRDEVADRRRFRMNLRVAILGGFGLLVAGGFARPFIERAVAAPPDG